jgi:hypothetical protein
MTLGKPARTSEAESAQNGVPYQVPGQPRALVVPRRRCTTGSSGETIAAGTAEADQVTTGGF